MSVDVTTLPTAEASDWNELVEAAPYTTPFHRYEILDLIASHLGARIHPLVGYKGEEPIGILPVFEMRRGPFRTVVSPPELEIFTLGPARLNFEKLKQRKAERRHREFITQCVSEIEELGPDYIDIRTVDRYADVRPFTWEGFDVSPAYTYVLDIDRDEDELLASFSRDARTNITADKAAEFSIEEGGVESITAIISNVRERLVAQGVDYPLTPQFVRRLYERLPKDAIRIHTVKVDGEHASGMITLEHGDTVYRWQGGAKTDDTPSINDVLDWGIIRHAKDRGFTRYDLVGANSARLSRYKAKFGPEASAYYVATRRSKRMSAALRAYHTLPESLRVF